MLNDASANKAATALIAISDDKIKPLPDTCAFDCRICIETGFSDPFNLAKVLLLKMLLNAISTISMAALGRISGNYMTYVTPSNKKLIDRATRIIAALANVTYETAKCILV